MAISSEFTRHHHRRIEAVLRGLRAERLRELRCFFGGGSAISLQLGEYRESIDIDFLCKGEGFHEMHTGVYQDGIRFLFVEPPQLGSELRRARDAIRCSVDLQDGGLPIKFEIVREGYWESLEGGATVCGVECLSKADSIACKLMANADRGLDPAHQFRDFIDAAVASHAWKQDAPAGFEKSIRAYNNDGSIPSGIEKVRARLDDGTLDRACRSLAIMPETGRLIREIIASGEPAALPVASEIRFP